MQRLEVFVLAERQLGPHCRPLTCKSTELLVNVGSRETERSKLYERERQEWAETDWVTSGVDYESDPPESGGASSVSRQSTEVC